MNRRLPRKVQGHLTSVVRSKARELLGDETYDTYFNNEADHTYRLFIVDQRCGTTSYSRKTVTLPHWAYVKPEVGNTVKKLKYKGPLLNKHWIYYLAHELAHVLSHAKTGSMGHGPHFMKTFMEICPEELQFFELGYKPRNAKAAGISL